ncbi:hypothetical protein FB451DRAFT_1180764 [Mycena latifolia]|nr:hypothetical protein FB451DRAFT_1180764 [Mycena latifolia]
MEMPIDRKKSVRSIAESSTRTEELSAEGHKEIAYEGRFGTHSSTTMVSGQRQHEGKNAKPNFRTKWSASAVRMNIVSRAPGSTARLLRRPLRVTGHAAMDSCWNGVCNSLSCVRLARGGGGGERKGVRPTDNIPGQRTHRRIQKMMRLDSVNSNIGCSDEEPQNSKSKTARNSALTSILRPVNLTPSAAPSGSPESRSGRIHGGHCSTTGTATGNVTPGLRLQRDINGKRKGAHVEGIAERQG